MRLAIICSQFNQKFTELLLQGALQRLTDLGITESSITIIRVPGAMEIPIAAQRLARSEKYAVIIGLGVVIRGETSHYDYVCTQVSAGCQRVALDYNLPVIFGVLTTENEEQALARLGGVHGHKGSEAAEAAVALVKALKSI
jgi:6,7-dimethyl-8-ribityllumazine synthase